MSQIIKNLASGPVPGNVATSYVTDIGTAIPALNILNINAGETNVNNDSGIQVIANPNLSNNVLIQLTNRITGTIITTDATPTTLASVSLGSVPGTYIAFGDVTCFDSTDNAGASYTFEGAAVTNGVSGTEIGNEIRNQFEQEALITSDFNFGVTGNTAFIQVIGIAGKTIKWNCLFNYRFVG